MKILHTSDWHVGKVLKGQSRLDEHIAVLAQVVEVARAERPDLVIVAGDMYDSTTPTADATRLVTRALSALRATGAAVVAIAGNHDNGAALDALRGWADAAGIVLRGTVRERPSEHIITGATGSGERWRLVALPFLSQRYAVRATEMFRLTAAEANQTYADHVARLIAALTAPDGPAAAGDSPADGSAADSPAAGGSGVINLVAAHLTVFGAKTGGGERDAHTVQAYAVPGSIFPPSCHYVALGHLHRAQRLLAPCPVYYSGSPLAIDFGEEENSPSVTLVEVSTTAAAKVRQVPLDAAVPLRTVYGTLDDLSTLDTGNCWLRVYVREPPRAGLREQVQQLLPRALEVRIDPAMLPQPDPAATRPRRAGRSPRELFGDYLATIGAVDPAVIDLFTELHAEVES